MTRDQDLLGLQVLLALVLLYQESKDPRPATLLIGAAVRLIHRLRFQSRDEIEALYTPQQGVHRSRLYKHHRRHPPDPSVEDLNQRLHQAEETESDA